MHTLTRTRKAQVLKARLVGAISEVMATFSEIWRTQRFLTTRLPDFFYQSPQTL